MKLILALGNPGARYRDTRHNVGWWLADRLRSRWSLPTPSPTDDAVAVSRGDARGHEVHVAYPLTFMNRSGRALARLVDPASVDDELLVLVDDVWLPAGRFRLKARGSAGGHNGLTSIEQVVGGLEYSRLRIGVGSPDDDAIDLAAWVLAPPRDGEESMILEEMDRMAEATECWMEDGIEAAMNRFNG